MTKSYWELNKFDVETRIEDEGRARSAPTADRERHRSLTASC